MFIKWATLVFVGLRLIRLELIPIFADEAIYLRWSQLISFQPQSLFVSLSDGKTPLFMWLLAPLLRFTSDPLLTGRLLAIFGGLNILLASYFLARQLFNLKVARITAALIVVNPFLFFYDRLSLTDSLLTGLIVWLIYAGLLLLQTPKLNRGVVLGFLAAAALLTKPSALLYLLLIPVWLLSKSPTSWVTNLKKSAPAAALAIFITAAIYNLQRASDAFHMISRRSADYLQPIGELLQNPIQFFPNTAKVFIGWLNQYQTPWFLLFFILAITIAIYKKNSKALILSLFVFIPFIIQASVGKIVYPRYLLPLIPPMLIIVSWLISLRKIGAVIFILLSITWLNFDQQLLTNPETTPLPYIEKEQYFYTWSSGYGLKEITEFLNLLPADQKVVVATEGSFGTLPNGLDIYFYNHPSVQILGVGFPKNTVSPAMEQALVDGKKVYLVANAHRYNFSSVDRLLLVAAYPRPFTTQPQEVLKFYEVLPLP